MNKMTTLEDLFVEEMKDIYNAENQLVKALPKVVKKATSGRLRDALEHHLAETRTHVERLEQAFGMIGQPAKSKKCEAMKGLLAEGNDILSAKAEDSVKDAGIISAAQKVEHYEIASYGCLRTYASLLGHDDVAELMGQTLEEEKNADQTLTTIAQSDINVQAAAGAAH